MSNFYEFNDFVSPTQKSNTYPYDLFGAPASFDLLAPHPDLFESELDSSADLSALSALDITPYNILDNQSGHNHPSFYSDFRSGYQGPASTITVSSESQSGYEFDTASFYSSRDSASGYMPSSDSPTGTKPPVAYPQRHQDVRSAYGSEIDLDFADFNLVAPSPITPPTMPRIPSLAGLGLDTYDVRDRKASNSHYQSAEPGQGQTAYYHPQTPTSPTSNDTNDSSSDTASLTRDGDRRAGSDAGPTRKYPCPNCPRSFARAFNLKTHLATHDPHRVKSFVCRHQGCGRSFSRKHDLGRHLTSIHAGEGNTSVGIGGSGHRPVADSAKALGGNKLHRERVWCDGCGRGWIKGTREACACENNTRG